MTEKQACQAVTPDPGFFNDGARLPHGLLNEHIQEAMSDFVTFLSVVNKTLNRQHLPRLERIIMPANFSSIVGEFVSYSIPKYCHELVKNRFHNGHPDLIPTGQFPDDAIQYYHVGIEIKASRYLKAWQGHNVEACWLLVLIFESNGPLISRRKEEARPFRFVEVLGAQLAEDDWKFSERSSTSRRTITASVTESGFRKMLDNWIYMVPELRERQGVL